MQNREIINGRYVGNKVIQHLAHCASEGHNIDDEDILNMIKRGEASKEEMLEYYQLMGYPVDNEKIKVVQSFPDTRG